MIDTLEPAAEPVPPRDNEAHLVPDVDALLEHRTDGGHCPCWPSVLEVTDPDRDGRTIGYLVRHHRGGIAEALTAEQLEAHVRPFLRGVA